MGKLIKHFYYNKKKILVSIIFGLIAFAVNFLSFSIYEHEGIRIDILIGLLFPMIIAIAWGWRYGLISALAGGCQTMWILWYNDGYGVLYAVPVFTLWIVFHGIVSDCNKKNKKRVLCQNKYIAEIFFRAVVSIGFFTVFTFLVSLNPPFWDGKILTNSISYEWLKLVVLKHILEAYMILLFADLLLRLNIIRKLLDIKERSEDTSYIIVYSIILGVIIWIIDAGITTKYALFPGNNFFDNLILDVQPQYVISRTVIVVAFAVIGILWSDAIEKKNISKRELKKQYNKVSDILKLTSSIEKAKEMEEKEFMAELLDTAMEVIEEADYGIAYIYGKYYARITAVSGHNDSIVDKKYRYLFRPSVYKDVYIIKEFKKNFMENPDENAKKVLSRIEEDKETMMVLLSSEGKNVASICLGIAKDSNKEFSKESIELAGLLKNIPSAFYTLIRDYESKQVLHKKLISSIVKILDLHDPYTNEHSTNVANKSVKIAEEMKLGYDKIENVYWAAIVHDIGKILIPKDILNKRGKLTKEEYEIVKKHPVWGYETLKEDESLSKLAKYVLHHHERWDGKGYPEGLSGESIPMVSRIIAVADAYDAMTSDRTYRKALGKDIAYKEMFGNSGTQFDPEIVEKFLKILDSET